MKRKTTALNMVTMFAVILLLTPSAAILAEGGSIDCYPASIGDTVWYDLDGSLTQNNGEKGIPAVTVFLYQGTCGGTPIASDVTDKFGAYLFADLDPDKDYCVAVDESTMPAPFFTNTTPNQYSDYLSDGEANTLADFGYRATVCLPTIDFETDSQGTPLDVGAVLSGSYQPWAAWGVTISTSNHAQHPVMVFDSSNPTGRDSSHIDWDLGTPNEDFYGPGIGDGGEAGTSGENSKALGKVMIISHDANLNHPPDDYARGGTVTFTFAQGLRMDMVDVLDIEEHAVGNVKAYDINGVPIKTATMGGRGDNSYQALDVSATGVYKLEISLPGSGGIPAIVFCGEDHDYDYGDLPDPDYPTYDASNGARHLLIDGGPKLGARVDAEANGQPSVEALGDDDNPDIFYRDEDGVVQSTIYPGRDFTVGIEVSSVATSAFVDVWFDFDNDGILANTTVEHFRIPVTSSSGSFTHDFPAPLDTHVGFVYARFRISTNGTDNPYGTAPDGEVEDWRFVSRPPLAVFIGSLTATAFVNAVRVEWEGINEFNTIGYNVERALSPDGPWTQLNGSMIPSKTDSLDVAVYDFVDTEVEQGVINYYYRLVSLDNSATPTYSEVIKVTVPVIGEPYGPYLPPTPASVHLVFLPMIGK